MQAERAQDAAPRPTLIAVLDIVLERPTHRGDIVRRVRSKYGHMVPVSDAWVRILINRAVADGLLEEMPLDAVERHRAQPRRQIRATAAGARAYRAWRADGPTTDIFDFGRRLHAAPSPTAKLAIIAGFEASCAAELSALAPPVSGSPLADELLYESKRRTLEIGLDLVIYARNRIGHEA